MTNTTMPTDAEIDRLLAMHWPAVFAVTEAVVQRMLRNAVREAIATWGAPAPASADVRTAAQALIDRWDTPNWKDAEHTGAFIQRLRETLAAPQEPEVRVPLSDEQIEALPMWKRFVGLWPETRREIARIIEAQHGIKGGQHDR